MKKKIWTKKCKCGNFIPDEYDRCDNCLLQAYFDYNEFTTFETDEYGRWFSEEAVIKAIRKAEQSSNKNKKR